MKINEILTEQEIAEMNRRDFLKGAGAAALAGAIGYKAGQDTSVPEAKKKYFTPRLWYLCGYGYSDYLDGYDRNVFDSIASEVNGILRDTPQWKEYVEMNQRGHEELWRDLKLEREKLGLPEFTVRPLSMQPELEAWLRRRMKAVLTEIKKIVGYV
jgi:hypothetical protein